MLSSSLDTKTVQYDISTSTVPIGLHHTVCITQAIGST